MSKLSQLHAELTEQAMDLGFESIEEAEANGYAVDYELGVLVRTQPSELEKAHEAWCKEREDILDDLGHLKNIYKEVKPDEDIIERAIEFVRGCKDGA